MRVLSVLGSTGSIGVQTLEVVRRNPGDFKIAGLSCGSDIATILEQIEEFSPELVSVASESKAAELREHIASRLPSCRTEVIGGERAATEVACLSSADTVVGAIVGFAGLEPVYHAIREGKDIALANKETLVAGGDFIMKEACSRGVDILPVDSEHCAIWQCLWGEKRSNLDRILLTASGGPFRGKKREDLENVTLEMALNHPTWKMGGKITIDSATMMNKGLEVIEAHHLYGIDVSKIDVVVHPQSVIHSMVRMKDGSVLAQMGMPSMILPIMVALYYPERGDMINEPFDPFCEGARSLTFEPCDTEVFGLLKLTYEVSSEGGILPAVMNGANEAAVASFLGGGIRFIDIETVVRNTVDAMSKDNCVASLDSVTEADRRSREIANNKIREILN
ncbi:MAG: 1-deoxy-D-xylulose-5-phosphate reductoisomerase [Clostridiales bacterium]|nr:1-deoxy-D-xylulose-5-phosphate reductoisomerase [Clostridiales bacterium]